jgi:hypothetical protein
MEDKEIQKPPSPWYIRNPDEGNSSETDRGIFRDLKRIKKVLEDSFNGFLGNVDAFLGIPKQ